MPSVMVRSRPRNLIAKQRIKRAKKLLTLRTASKKNANAGSALDDEGPLSLSEPQAALVHKLFAWPIDPCLSFVRERRWQDLITACH